VSILDTGNADVAETTVAVNSGSGDGRFSLAQTLVIDTNATIARLEDLNGDGDLDVSMVGVRGSNFGRTGLFVFPNLGGSLGSAAYYQYASGGLAIGDYNLDGHPDVASSCFFDVQAVKCPGSAATVLLNRGDGTFARRSMFMPGGYAISGTTIDVQNDGKPDIVLLFSGFPSFFTEYVNVTE
jgi:hypothetical protein